MTPVAQVSQTAFRAALLDAALPVPFGLTTPDGQSDARRFAVYRNNVAVGLTEALRQAFPVILALVGEPCFDGIAALYLRAHPPTSPLMMFYGAAMPDVLAALPSLSHLGYLPDMARLELALRESYHAADAVPVAADRLAALPPADLPGLRLRLAPPARLIRSRWPVASIWRAHHGGPPPRAMAEDVLVLRPGFDPAPHVLPPGGGAFTAALLTGETLGNAALAGTADFPDFDIAALLGQLLAQGALVPPTDEVLP